MAAITIVEPNKVAPRKAVIKEKNSKLGALASDPFARINMKIVERTIPSSKIGDRSGIMSEVKPRSTFPKNDPTLK